MRGGSLISAIAMTILLALPALGDQLSDAIEAKDFSRALQLLRPLAEAGDPGAQGLLGDMYLRGNGVPQDQKEAIKWWMRAAEGGEPFSQSRLGDIYATGQGVKKNLTEAAKWWRKGAEQNVPRAQTGLGLALYQGQGVQQDKAEAAKWFAKAADQDEAHAQKMLAIMYSMGEGGLEQSFVEAYKWALIAGDAAASTKISLEVFMRKTQQQDAIRLAEQWKFDKGKIKNPPRPVESSDEIAALYFVNLRSLSAKCSSTSANDLAWCEAYIAGVIDTLGSGRNDLAADAKDARLCLRKKVSLSQARQAVSKVITHMQEYNSPIILNSPATNSVIAGVLGHLCE